MNGTERLQLVELPGMVACTEALPASLIVGVTSPLASVLPLALAAVTVQPDGYEGELAGMIQWSGSLGSCVPKMSLGTHAVSLTVSLPPGATLPLPMRSSRSGTDSGM